jgi:hypothetical protein
MSQNSAYKSSTGTSKFKSKPLIFFGEHFFQNLEELIFGAFRETLSPILLYTVLQLLLHMLYCILICVLCFANEICKFFNSQIGRHARDPSALDDTY